MPRRVTVSFVSSPGQGKSTLADLLIRVAKEEGWEVGRRDYFIEAEVVTFFTDGKQFPRKD